jgi:hypothetical protein
MKLVFTCFLSLALSISYSQNQKPCSAPEASQFDFWVGEWDASWGDTLKGSNKIEKLYGSCVVHENFSDPKSNFLGQSWSVYNSNYKLWQQTWIDNNGGYIHLTGGMNGDSMVLATDERTVPGSISATGKLKNRMVYYNITKDSFDWSWEASTDGGKTWKSNWLIHYKRKR